MAAVDTMTIPHVSALAPQDPGQIASLLANSADLTVLLTADGIICDQVIASPELPPSLFIGWPGRALSETVTVESRQKINQLINDAGNDAPARWRQVNHPVHGGADIPISYTALKAGPEGHIIAVGRDMSGMAALQRRLLAAEQSIEQEYQRLRNAETRFRILLQSASDAIIVVEAKTGRVAECNPAAAALLNRPLRKLQSANINDVFEEVDGEKIKVALYGLQTAGRAEDIVLSPTADNQQAVLSFSMFRQENATYYLLRMTAHAVGTSAVVMPKAQSRVVQVINSMPDGFVVADQDMKVLTANAAFLELAQLGSEDQARGVHLDRWIGRQGFDVDSIMSRLRDAGSIRSYRTIMRGQYGAVEDVEISGVFVAEGDTPCFGLSLHYPSRSKPASETRSIQDHALLRTGDDFTRLVGKLPLKDLVRESTDIIEKLCIEAALRMNGDNRAGAAEMLGLSRQSLYVKLHRYGIDTQTLNS
jgi:transcriptional regulator PpsR